MRTLPPGYQARPPVREDAEAIAAMIAASQAADTGEPDMTLDEFLGDWEDIDLAEEALVVVAPDGSPAGYVDLANRSFVQVSVYGFVHPYHRGKGIGRFLVDWGEQWARDRIGRAPDGARVSVRHYVNARSEQALALLAAAGYEAQRTTYIMETVLDGPVPPPEVPAGVTLRSFARGQDEQVTFETVEDAFRDLWGRPRGTFEQFLNRAQSDLFDPSLWFLADAGEEIAGVALCRNLGGEGWIDTLGVRRGWRGKGIGLALLRHAFGEFQRRGVTVVGLSVDAESRTGAPRLYARAGMAIKERYVVLEQELRAGVDLGDRSGEA